MRPREDELEESPEEDDFSRGYTEGRIGRAPLRAHPPALVLAPGPAATLTVDPGAVLGAALVPGVPSAPGAPPVRPWFGLRTGPARDAEGSPV